LIAVVGRDQQTFVETTFTLDPRGRRSCEAILPEGYRLLDVRINGRAHSAWQAAPRRWQLQFQSSQLPQLIQLAAQSEGRAPAQSRVSIEVPSPILLVDGTAVPVQQTAWQLQSDSAWRLAERGRGDLSEVSSPMLAAVRLANLVETLDEFVPALLGSPAENWATWLDYWRGRVDAANAQFDLSAAAHDDHSSGAVSRDDLREAAVLARQKAQQMATLNEALPSAARPALDGGGRSESPDWELVAGEVRPHFSLQLLSDGRREAIRLELVETERSYRAERIFGSFLLSVIALGAVVTMGGKLGRRIGTHSTLAAITLLALALLAIASGNLWAIIGGLILTCIVVGWCLRRTHA
jgi:hypothetical protein